jgi:protein TonB
MVQMSMDEPPPPPPPPPPPAGEESEPEEDIPEEEVELEEDIVQPKDTPENIPEVKSTGSKGPKAPGVPGGMPGGVPGGVPGGIPGGVVGGGAIATKRDTSKDQISKQPIKVVKGNGIYTPDCDASKLQQTQTARMGNRKGSTKISFCVSESGKVEDVRTIKKFPGDAKVDQICSAEVKKWRFKPFLVGGKPRKTCSVVEFKLIFN